MARLEGVILPRIITRQSAAPTKNEMIRYFGHRNTTTPQSTARLTAQTATEVFV